MNDEIIEAFNDNIYLIKENLLVDLNKSFFSNISIFFIYLIFLRLWS